MHSNTTSYLAPIDFIDVSEWSDSWRQLPIKETNEPLVDLNNAHPAIFYKPMYHILGMNGAIKTCFVRKSVLSRLVKAVTILQSLKPNFSFLVYDAWRPKEVQQALFDDYYIQISRRYPHKSNDECIALTEQFVSQPSIDALKPSPHITGGAIDLTILDDTKTPLAMGTDFDDFTDKAHTSYFEHNDTHEHASIRNNRRLLYHVMIQSGFTNFPFEWWHYDYGNQFWAQNSRSLIAHYSTAKIK